MKIAYVGNFKQRHCTEVHIASTLESLGHTVIRIQEDEIKQDALHGMIAYADWDMFLFTRTWGNLVTLRHLSQLKERKIPSVSYHLDLYVGLSRKYLHEGATLETVLQTDPFWRTDFVFTPDGDPGSQKIFEQNGVNHYYLPAGVFGPECYLEEERGVGADVLFVGGGDYPGSPNGYGHPEWPYRDKLIQWLRDTYGDSFVKKGHPQETVRNDELNRLYADSKVVVGDSVCLDFKHKYYWSDRVYETIGRGGFLIHPFIEGLDDEFKDGETIVFYEYGNLEDLKQKIDYYLQHDEEREQIRINGHEFVKRNCTYTQRLTELLKIVTANVTLPTFTHQKVLRINIGAGSEPTDGWCNVDWIDQDGIDVVHNLLEFPWPFEDNSADEIKAIDVLEHMPSFTPDMKSNPIAFVEECHRILKPGGKLTIQVPHYQSPNLWIDPTHVRGYDLRSFDYFDPERDLGKSYGYYSDKKFNVSATLSRMRNGQPSNVTFVMVKI